MSEMDSIDGRKTLQEVRISKVVLRPGDTVRLSPLGRADIFDMVLEGRLAVIDAIEEDLEGRIYLAVVVKDDPGHDFGLQKQPGHRFFFGVEEIEKVEQGDDAT